MDNFLPSSQTSSSVLIAQTQFAFDLLREAGLNKSVVIAPSSISIALGTVLYGAKNNTYKQFQNAFAKDVEDEEIHKALSNILFSLTHKNILLPKSNATKLANKVYFAKNLPLLESYKTAIQKLYSGNFEFIDFADYDQTVKEINKFVTDSVDNEMQNIVTPGMFEASTKIALISAISFEKKWDIIFETNSSKSKFYSNPTKTNEILMMEGVTFSRYLKKEHYECVQIPFQDQIFSMYIILPREKYGLSEILKNINVIEILEFMEISDRQKGKIIIPKFEKLESSFQLSGDDEISKHLKIEDAFDQNRADFGGISTDKKFHISKLVHRAVVKTLQLEAPPPAKEVIFVRIITQPITFTFIADHSFLYFIADKARNVHFVGTYYD